MQVTKVLSNILGMKSVQVRGCEFDEVGLVIDVAPTTRVARCGGCGCRVRRLYDRRSGRRWRHLDLGGMRVELRYDVRRVDCARCGVRTEFVPWAEPDSQYTRPFEAQVSYLAQRMDKTAIRRPDGVQATNQPLYRAMLLKDSLASILDRRQYYVARDQLAGWLAWASRSKLVPFVRVARTIRKHLHGILAYLNAGLSNRRSAGLNGKARVITRRSYGLPSAQSLIAMLFLCCSLPALTPVKVLPKSRPLAC